ncbi:MAG: TolC family protein [Gammaproteobacteria bacterium]
MKPLALVIALAILCRPAAGMALETLDDAWRIALADNHHLRSVVAQQRAAARGVAQAEATRLPQLTLSANYMRLDNPPTIQGKFAGQDFRFGYWERSALYYSAYSTLPLYTSGRIPATIAAARAGENAARRDAESETQELKMAVAAALIDVLRTKHGIALAESHLASLTRHQRDVGNLRHQGLVANTDVLAAAVSIADARQQLTTARNRHDLASATYNRLLARPLEQPVALAEPVVEVDGRDLALLTASALAQRSELAALRQRITALTRRADSVRAAARPQVALGGGYGYQENANQVSESVWAANVGVVWQVFDGGASRHESADLNHQAAALQAQLDDLQTRIELQVRQAWLDYNTTGERLAAAASAVAQGEENLTATGNLYREGMVSHSQVLDAETLRLRAYTNRLNATYDRVLAGLLLHRALGTL